ncbi:lipase [Rhodococcus sp. 06-156-3C]|uniref:lipase family protein n=1 Tax=Nocardiaceae TaxID=85025 RepID=UPI000523059A|nr:MULTISPECIES: lipase family protein [Rhodococcus]OZD17734.1 lipase [Rhodococcus sp. 06-156-4C]OZD21465.1 lipase [Rhodococcus sp. 06-156-4a]OZD23988.1 lipase [Rhodococcus sp. 06-156-3b]OZD25161.1 lipase [Rhodococcus sp. 06-156-3C]OZD40105.1 lipase [Rhodococcus sp. 06-156-3]
MNLRVVTVVLSLAAAVLIPVATASADPGSDFYSPPAEFDSTPGSLVRTEPLPLLASFPGADGTWPGKAQRVMYSSRLQDDSPVAVTGTYIEASQPWRGTGERPTIVVAPGTVGQGDQCAPSKAFQTGLNATLDPVSFSANQEQLAASVWIARGARVFVTDYVGLGTPGVHTYVNRIEEAHAVLDAARVANVLSGTGSSTPLALWGYSQGGGAVAAAAEMQPSYAPELNVKGTWAGAPPADLLATLGQVDGTLIGGVIGFAVNGFVARRPELLEPFNARLTPEGKAVMAELSNACIGDVILRHPFLRTETFTADHQPLLANLRTIPEAAPIFDEQRIGTLTPTTPVLVTSGRNDDTVPYEQARQLAVDWCDNGATVDFVSNDLPPILPGAVLPNHFGPDLIDGYGTGLALNYITDRLNDVPLASGCRLG